MELGGRDCCSVLKQLYWEPPGAPRISAPKSAYLVLSEFFMPVVYKTGFSFIVVVRHKAMKPHEKYNSFIKQTECESISCHRCRYFRTVYISH